MNVSYSIAHVGACYSRHYDIFFNFFFNFVEIVRLHTSDYFHFVWTLMNSCFIDNHTISPYIYINDECRSSVIDKCCTRGLKIHNSSHTYIFQLIQNSRACINYYNCLEREFAHKKAIKWIAPNGEVEIILS